MKQSQLIHVKLIKNRRGKMRRKKKERSGATKRVVAFESWMLREWGVEAVPKNLQRRIGQRDWDRRTQRKLARLALMAWPFEIPPTSGRLIGWFGAICGVSQAGKVLSRGGKARRHTSGWRSVDTCSVYDVFVALIATGLLEIRCTFHRLMRISMPQQLDFE